MTFRPGDVARATVVTGVGGDDERGDRRSPVPVRARWARCDNPDYFYNDDEDWHRVEEPRRLYLVDLEGLRTNDTPHEIINRLYGISESVDDWALANVVRQLIQQDRPAKPEEPTEFGSIVETFNGKKYVRLNRGGLHPWISDDGYHSAGWAELDAVKVIR